MAPTIIPHTPSKVLQDVGIRTEAELKDSDYASLKTAGIQIEDLSAGDEAVISLNRGGAGYFMVTLPMRRDAYNRAMDKLSKNNAMPGWLVSFRTFMEDQFGPLANVHRHTGAEGLPWDQAFIIGRYGETTTFWPDGEQTGKSFTENDRKRAELWVTRMRFASGISIQPHKKLSPPEPLT
jgi:hypothetical protein